MDKARDIMTKNIYSVKEETSIIEAILLLIEKKVAGLPVVNNKSELTGIITEKDMMNLVTSGCKDPSIRVEEFMNRKIMIFSPDDKLDLIAKTFKEKSFRMVPIVENNQLVGVVARRDIIQYILNDAFDLK